MIQNETIVDRVVARLKAQPLGDLITEEDLHDIVKTAIPKAFFEPQRHNAGSSAYPRWETGEPVIVEIMRGLLKDAAKEQVKTWVTAHADMMAEHWKKVVDVGLLTYVQQIQNEQATGAVRQALAEWVRAINDERQKQGLSPIYAPV